MVKKENLIELMHQKYQRTIPKAIYQQQDFKKIRVYDFKINNYLSLNVTLGRLKCVLIFSLDILMFKLAGRSAFSRTALSFP